MYIPQIAEKEKEEYYQEASMKGPGSRLTKDFFTVIGKMKVLQIISTPSPNFVLLIGDHTQVQLPSRYVLRDYNGWDGQWKLWIGVSWMFHRFIISVFSCYSPDKLDPRGPAYDKYKKSKKFDPDRSSVLMVINDQLRH